MQGDTADKLDIEVHHLPFDRMIIDLDFLSTHAARTVFHHGISLGKNGFEIFGASALELRLDVMERGFRGLDRLRSGGDGCGQRREFIAQRFEPLLKIASGGGKILRGHPLDDRFRRDLQFVITGKMRLPFGGHFTQFLLRLTLQRFFNFINTRDGGSDPAYLTHVFATDDFLEYPLDHEKLGCARNGLRNGVHTLGGAKRQALECCGFPSIPHRHSGMESQKKGLKLIPCCLIPTIICRAVGSESRLGT